MTSTSNAPASDAPARQVRFVELDSLRGLAALIVVLHHLQLLWQDDTQPTSAILKFFLDLVAPFGTEAVMLFFVLSGFVLSLPAVNGKPQTYFTFLIRRIFRIYVPYLAAIAVSVAGAFWLHGNITSSDWLNGSWSEPVNWRLVLQHVTFVGTYDTEQFDDPIWSLVHEMRISLIFPLLCGFVLRLKSKWSFAIAAGLTLTAIMIVRRPLRIEPSIADSFHYAGLFVLGIFLARERSRLGAWYKSQRQLARAVIGTAALLLFLFAGSQMDSLIDENLHRSLYHMSQWIAAFGAGGLIIVSLNSTFLKRILSWQPIHFLGEISYSLYLWHFVVLLFCVHLLYGKIPLSAILFLVFVLSIAVSWFSYRWIELPSMNLGRRLSNAFRSPAGAHNQIFS